MKRTHRIALIVGTGLIFMIAYPELVKRLRQRDAPPSYVVTDVDLIKWMGRPEWVMKYSSTNEFYYEIGRDEPLILSLFTASSGPPSYTVDQTGRFIGWSPDSGEIKKPDQIYSNKLIRERVDVDSYIRDLSSRKAFDRQE